MSFAYLPLYTGDYFRDTRGLSMAGHGCYLLLLTYCWDKRGPLPLEEEIIAGICNARSAEERTTMQRVLETYFTRMEDGWYQDRMQREIERAEAISRERSEAGRKGYQAKAKHLPSKSQASASNPTTNTIPAPEPYQKKKDTVEASAKNADLRDVASRIIERLNRLAGKRFKAAGINSDLVVARLREGFTERDLRIVVALKCQQWLADEKMSRYLVPKTLFNRTNFASYAGSVPAEFSDPEGVQP